MKAESNYAGYKKDCEKQSFFVFVRKILIQLKQITKKMGSELLVKNSMLDRCANMFCALATSSQGTIADKANIMTINDLAGGANNSISGTNVR